MKSLFAATCSMPRFEALNESIKTDVLVIGGGITGLLTAFALKECGVDAVVVEQDRICSGVTRCTTAKITAQHGLIYADLLAQKGEERAALYYRANAEALARYRELAQRIDCDFEPKDSFVYSVTDRTAIERELEALARLGVKASLQEALPLPFPTQGAVRMSDQAQFHPLRFLAALAKDLRIFEGTAVGKLCKNLAVCNNGAEISAQNIVVTTHFPFLNRHGAYPLKLHQSRSYTLALKGAADVGGMYVDAEEKGFSFRNYGEYLLLSGGGHRTGLRGGGFRRVQELASVCYPRAEIAFRSATQDCMSLDAVPYIGRYGKCTKGLFVATGFNKWGMTSAMVASQLLRDLILERENPYAALFDPTRAMLSQQLFVNLGVTLSHYVRPTPPRCPHLGCALSWNKQEHTWDCPCHGSRFSEDGALLKGPATKGLSKPHKPKE